MALMTNILMNISLVREQGISINKIEVDLMQIEGKKYICDRCKLESFAVKKETLVLDGGYTREPIFEIAEGWTRQNRGSEWCDLCPTCSEKLQRVIDGFWEKTEDEDGEINNKI